MLRRIEVSLPPHLLVELDSAVGSRPVHVSRSRVIAIAIRRFLDDGEMEELPTYPEWPWKPNISLPAAPDWSG